MHAYESFKTSRCSNPSPPRGSRNNEGGGAYAMNSRSKLDKEGGGVVSVLKEKRVGGPGEEKTQSRRGLVARTGNTKILGAERVGE